jgi:hypothetical protein
MAILTAILDWVVAHIAIIGLVLTWAGIGLVYYRRRSDWAQKQFADQVNFSLNYVIGDMLAMRTLLECTVKDVWLNDFGVKKVRAAARLTTPEQPFILLEDQADRDFVHRAVINTLSERFAAAFVAEALGVPVHTGKFIFAITYERYDIMRTLKFRVLIMEERTLVQLFGPGGRGDSLQVSNPVFLARLKSLRAIYELYAKDQATRKGLVDQVQLGVPV